jgi:hypothetical protein
VPSITLDDSKVLEAINRFVSAFVIAITWGGKVQGPGQAGLRWSPQTGVQVLLVHVRNGGRIADALHALAFSHFNFGPALGALSSAPWFPLSALPF